MLSLFLPTFWLLTKVISPPSLFPLFPPLPPSSPLSFSFLILSFFFFFFFLPKGVDSLVIEFLKVRENLVCSPLPPPPSPPPSSQLPPLLLPLLLSFSFFLSPSPPKSVPLMETPFCIFLENGCLRLFS